MDAPMTQSRSSPSRVLVRRFLIEEAKQRRISGQLSGQGFCFDCPICLELVDVVEAVRFSCSCECVYHRSCTDRLAQSSCGRGTQCPTCRRPCDIASLCDAGASDPLAASDAAMDTDDLRLSLKQSLRSMSSSDVVQKLVEDVGALRVVEEMGLCCCQYCYHGFHRLSDISFVRCDCKRPWTFHAHCRAKWGRMQHGACPKCNLRLGELIGAKSAALFSKRRVRLSVRVC